MKTAGRRNKVQRLIDLGFENIGVWHLVDGVLSNGINGNILGIRNFLYAFITGDRVRYIGKSSTTLRQRMNGYKNPGPTQRTNIRIKEKIIELVNGRQTVGIMIFLPQETLKYKGWNIDIASGLENILIETIKPDWNILGI